MSILLPLLIITSLIAEVMNYATTKTVMVHFTGAGKGIFGMVVTALALGLALVDFSFLLDGGIAWQKIQEDMAREDWRAVIADTAVLMTVALATVFNFLASYLAFKWQGESHPQDITAALGAHAVTNMALALAATVLLLRFFVIHLLVEGAFDLPTLARITQQFRRRNGKEARRSSAPAKTRERAKRKSLRPKGQPESALRSPRQAGVQSGLPGLGAPAHRPTPPPPEPFPPAEDDNGRFDWLFRGGKS